MRFLWRTDYAPNKLNSVPVTLAAGRLTPVVMAKNPDWIGRITGVALAVRGPLGGPARVSGMAAKSGGVFGQLADRLGEWLAFEPWTGASINTITGGADVQELPLPTLLVVALALAAGRLVRIRVARAAHAALPAVLALLFVVTWLCSTRSGHGTSRDRSGRPARNTAARIGASATSRPKTARSSSSSKVRARIAATPARVFVVADAPYFRGRGAYHLYPHNVLFDPFANTVPQASSLHAGDYVLVYQRRGVQYNAEEKKLRWEADHRCRQRRYWSSRARRCSGSDRMDILALIAGLLLPWWLGKSVLLALRPRATGSTRRARSRGSPARATSPARSC